MLSDAELIVNLNYYENQYNLNAADQRNTLLCSKNSILEVCGWVEQAMDKFVHDAISRCTLSTGRIRWIEQQFIRNTYGFSYQKHFEKMVISVVGYQILEKAEVQSGGHFARMNGSLSALIDLRNHYAHTHFDIGSPYPNSMTAIPTPSVMRQHALHVKEGLTELERALTLLQNEISVLFRNTSITVAP